MERLVKGRLITHLEINNLIGDSQHGSINKCIWLTSLLDFFAQVIDTYDTDNNKAVDLVYLDFPKEFDKVPHERRLVKVNAHGIQGDTARWIRNWLAGRCQRVCINQSYSNWAPVTSGVPQDRYWRWPIIISFLYSWSRKPILSAKCRNLQTIPNFDTELITQMTYWNHRKIPINLLSGQ